MSKILVADDDKAFTITLAEWLKTQSFGRQIDIVHSGDDAWHYLKSSDYDLVLLDWEMPGLAGIDLVRKFRQSGGETPVLMLTGKTSIEDKEAGLDAGADDYLTKPFHFRELGARLRAILRRPPQVASEVIKFRHIELDRGKRQVTASDKKIALQPLEFDVLEFFILHPGEVVSIEALLSRLWGQEGDVSSNALYSCIKKLRKKLDVEGEASIFESQYGVGYCLNKQTSA